MKHTILSILIALAIPLTAFAQLDTVYTLQGEKLQVKVTRVNENSIEFTYPGESLTNVTGKEKISRIHFHSGRTQVFNPDPELAHVRSGLDWKKVLVTSFKSEVENLQEICMVGAKSRGVTVFTSTAAMQNKAIDKLKQATAMVGGNVVHLINVNTEKGGGTSGSTLMGRAYTDQVFNGAVMPGNYKLLKALKLSTNSNRVKDMYHNPERVALDESDIINENGNVKVKTAFNTITNDLNSLSNSAEQERKFTVLYANEKRLVLSHTTKANNGRITYYNLFLTNKSTARSTE